MNNKVHTDSIDNMRSIIEAPGDSGMPVVFPVHPGTQKLLQEYGLMEGMPGNVSLIKPLGYPDMLMADARKIVTHSGGIQKEACMLGEPCITLRGNTEWLAGGRVECAGGGGDRYKEVGRINIQHILTLSWRSIKSRSSHTAQKNRRCTQMSLLLTRFVNTILPALGLRTPDPGEAPPLAGFNIKYILAKFRRTI